MAEDSRREEEVREDDPEQRLLPESPAARARTPSPASSPTPDTALERAAEVVAEALAAAAPSSPSGAAADSSLEAVAGSLATEALGEATEGLSEAPTPGPTQVDLALRRPTDASSSKSPQRAHNLAVDGNHNTRWTSAYADGQWLAVDLGVPYKLDRVEIRWEYAHAASYRIEGSNEDDPMTWRSLATEAGREGLVVTRLPTGSEARWVRMFGERRGTSYGFSIWEFRVYADPTAPLPMLPRRPLPMPALIPIFPSSMRLTARGRQLLGPGAVMPPVLPRAPRPARTAPGRPPVPSVPTPNPVAPTAPLPAPATASNAIPAPEPMPAPAAAIEPEPPGLLRRLLRCATCPSRREARKPPPPKLDFPLNGPYLPPVNLEHMLGEVPCSICFELLRGSAITVGACGHIFHERCLRLADMASCPQCRCSRDGSRDARPEPATAAAPSL